MGFMHIGSVGGSDNTFDHASACADAFADQLLKIVNKNDNEHNTPGYIDVALIIKDMCQSDYFKYSDKMKIVAKLSLNLIKQHRGWTQQFPKETKVLIKSLEKFLKDA